MGRRTKEPSFSLGGSEASHHEMVEEEEEEEEAPSNHSKHSLINPLKDPRMQMAVESARKPSALLETPISPDQDPRVTNPPQMRSLSAPPPEDRGVQSESQALLREKTLLYKWYDRKYVVKVPPPAQTDSAMEKRKVEEFRLRGAHWVEPQPHYQGRSETVTDNLAHEWFHKRADVIRTEGYRNSKLIQVAGFILEAKKPAKTVTWKMNLTDQDTDMTQGSFADRKRVLGDADGHGDDGLHQNKKYKLSTPFSPVATNQFDGSNGNGCESSNTTKAVIKESTTTRTFKENANNAVQSLISPERPRTKSDYPTQSSQSSLGVTKVPDSIKSSQEKPYRIKDTGPSRPAKIKSFGPSISMDPDTLSKIINLVLAVRNNQLQSTPSTETELDTKVDHDESFVKNVLEVVGKVRATSQRAATEKLPRTFYYWDGTPAEVGDLVVRLRQPHDLDPGNTQLGSDMWDGPWIVMDLMANSQNEMVAPKDIHDLRKTSMTSMAQLDFPDESVVKDRSVGLYRLIPVFEHLCSKGKCMAETCAQLNPRRTLESFGRKASVNSTSTQKPEPREYLFDLHPGSRHKCVHMVSDAQYPSKVEKIRAKRLVRSDVAFAYFSPKHAIDPWVKRLETFGIIPHEGEAFVAEYLVKWHGWPVEDDNWIQGIGTIPRGLIEDYNNHTDPYRNLTEEEALDPNFFNPEKVIHSGKEMLNE